MKIIEIKKLAAVDMAWNGKRIITIEYFLGIILLLLLGLFCLYKAQIFMGIWLLSISVNYIPLFVYALKLTQTNTVEKEGKPEIAHAKRYGLQQIILIIPLFVLILSIIQEIKRKSN